MWRSLLNTSRYATECLVRLCWVYACEEEYFPEAPTVSLQDTAERRHRGTTYQHSLGICGSVPYSNIEDS